MPKSYEQQHCEHEIRQIKESGILHGTIEGVLTATNGESFGLRIRTFDDSKLGKFVNVWVDCDPEGNGPGHLNIEPAT